MQIVIPDWTPSRLNQYQGRHWAVKAKLKKIDREMIAAYSHGIPKATAKRRVHMTLHLKGVFPDPDSVWKGCLDGLKHAGMLVDDSYKWVELAPVEMIRGPKATIITLTDIE